GAAPDIETGGMAGLIAGADIMSGGRTPQPYHTRPGMVSQGNDGKPPASIPGRNVLRAAPGSGGTGSRSVVPVRPCRTGAWSRSVTSAARPRPRCVSRPGNRTGRYAFHAPARIKHVGK